MYLTDWAPATLPLDHPGFVSSPRPRPCLPESGLAGGMVAVRLADLTAVQAADGKQVLVPTGSARPRPGEMVAWCTVAATGPAVLDAQGNLAAADWLPDQVRLGVLEEHLGAGTVEQVVAACDVRPVVADEELSKRRLRLMSLPLVARLVLAMTLLPNASYVEAFAQLVGVLPRLPWARAWHVPSSTVVTDWRRRLGVNAIKDLFDRVAGPIVAATDPAGWWQGLRVCALDGCQLRVPDTQANRAAFGSSGTADDGSASPFPLVRVVVATARVGRALLAACFDASSVGEQTLTARLVAEHPHLFTHEHLYVVDRNFLSHDFIDAVHQSGRGAHLLMRVKDGIRLPVIERLGPGEYLSYFGSGPRRVKLRVVEYDVTLPDGTVSELFCLATTLLDHHAYPAAEIAEVYRQRWSASETTIGENKSTITDAGPSRGPNLRSEEPDLVRQETWAWLAATQLVRKAAYAATLTTSGVSTDQISFTTARREVTRSMVQSLVTATTSPGALAEAADMAARGIISNLVTVNRDRHSPRQQKCRPKFPHTATTKTTTRGPLKLNFGISPRPDTS